MVNQEENSRKITDAILLRKLSFKSKLGYGDNSHLTVQDVINADRQADLVWAYYNLSMISFLDEVLDALKIDKEERIDKPGKNTDLGDTVIKRFEINNLETNLVNNKDSFINNAVYKTDAGQPLN